MNISFPLKIAELGNTLLMASTGKGRVQPDLYQIKGHTFADNPCPDAENIGIIMFSAHPCGILIMTDGGTDLPVSVGGNGDADTRSADEHPPLALTIRYKGDDTISVIGVVDGFQGMASHILDNMAETAQETDNFSLELVTPVIGTDGNFHSFLLKISYPLNRFSAMTALVPPNPKELDKAASIFMSRACRGT
jgi:hypothetical protein